MLLLALLLAVAPPPVAPPVVQGADAGAPGPIAVAAPDAGLATPEGGVGPMPTFVAVRAETPPRIDGEPDDAVWQKALPLDDFTEQQPEPGAQPTVKTRVRFAYDETALYVFVECQDDQPHQVSRLLTRRDRLIESDYVAVEVDSRGDKKSAYGFALYPTNVQVDYVRTGDYAQDFDWDAVWTSATRRTPQGWSAELAIPLGQMRFTGGADVRFRVNVMRYVSRKGETDELVYQPPDQQGTLLRMANLVGLHHLSAGNGLELLPFVLGRFDHRYSPGPGYDPPSNRHASLGVGGDLTWHPATDLTLDATVLPDFGQVEADQVILNLSTFETFFPEKRPFFLAGADLFALHDQLGNTTNTQLFYSRRVGRAPDEPVLDTGERLLEQPLSNDIWGALKLTGHVTDNVSVALLDAVSRRELATIQRADGSAEDVPVSPLANFAVARVRAELGHGFTAGATATGVTRRDRGLGGPLGCPGEGDLPDRNGRCTADAYTGGLDATWSSSSGSYVAMATLLGSHRVGGPPIVEPDGNTIGPGDDGFGGLAQFAKAGGSWVYSISYEGYSPKLDLNETGYLRQQNLHQLTVTGDYRTLKPKGPTLNTDTAFYSNAKESTDGVNVGRHFQVSESIYWKNFWGSYGELDLDPSYTDNRELRDGSLYERALSYGAFVAGHSNSRQPLSFNGYLGVWTTREGRAFSTNVTFTYRPLPQLELQLGPQLDWSNGDPRWFSTDGASDQSGPRVYHLANLDARATSATLRGTWTFTPRLTLQAYAQLFVATGHYASFFDAAAPAGRANVRLSDLVPVAAPSPDLNPDFKDGNVNVNVVLRWEYLPGSVAYLVYSRAQAQGDVDPTLPPNRPDLAALRHGPYDDVLLLKVSYYFGT